MDAEPGALILRTADLLAAGWTKESIRRAVRRGALVRIRRGQYCPAAFWDALDARARHVILATAVAEDVEDAIIAGRSAAALWGMPGEQWPDDILLLSPYRGGGKSEPGVRRTCVGAAGAPVVIRNGLRVTTLARTVVDIAATEGFVTGVAAADWALRHGVERSELRDVLRLRSSSYGRAVAASVIEFADEGAENGGESTVRAVIFELGFETPETQFVVRDRLGEMRVDFSWLRADGVRVFGELDGKQKYTRYEFTDGDPAEVVWREKKREDRLRVTGSPVVRILWAHLRDLPTLVALLSEAGVPRRSGARLDPRGSGSNRARLQPSRQK
ncbi:MAG: type IV toxin-antitoxin system AbiEi family antitoxin domain-containing protein [Pseudolysinimonas sp.]|uniref:type IV toxin-antitoxin system AbiEi family antitoxin domain-containing protein n=1 Tax=Pseudolysinimonas sp. TaxID=2680009 RepID=UPI003263FDD6